MDAPHVERLRYRIRPGRWIAFSSTSPSGTAPVLLLSTKEMDPPPPITARTDECVEMLADDLATVEMLRHHPSGDDARATVEPYLRAWEIHAAVNSHKTGDPFLAPCKGQRMRRRMLTDHSPPPSAHPSHR